MSILTSIINSVRSAMSNDAFEQIKVRDMHDQIIDAIKEASADGKITSNEIKEVTSLTDKLEITDEEFDHVKIQVLKDLLDHILEDQKVTEDEMALLKEVETSLSISDDPNEELQAKIKKVKDMYQA